MISLLVDLDMFEKKGDGEGLADQGVFEFHIAVPTREEVMKEEVEFAELFQRLPGHEIRHSHEKIREDATGDCRGKGDVRAVGPNQENGHDHVHRYDGIDRDVGDR